MKQVCCRSLSCYPLATFKKRLTLLLLRYLSYIFCRLKFQVSRICYDYHTQVKGVTIDNGDPFVKKPLFSPYYGIKKSGQNYKKNCIVHIQKRATRSRVKPYVQHVRDNKNVKMSSFFNRRDIFQKMLIRLSSEMFSGKKRLLKSF